MQVEAISSEVARLNAIQRAQMMAAMRRVATSTTRTSVTAELDRPFDVFLSGNNLAPESNTDISTSLQNGLYA